MTRILATTAALAALAVPAFAATKAVKVTDDRFVASSITIRKGDTVKWTWSGRHRHNVYQFQGPGHFHSPTHSRTGTFTHRFTKRGTYVFQCTYHAAMRMTVKVK